MVSFSKPGEVTAETVSNGEPSDNDTPTDKEGDNAGSGTEADEPDESGTTSEPVGVEVGPKVPESRDSAEVNAPENTMIEWGWMPNDEPTEMPLTEAVELASQMLLRPEEFGIATEGEIRDLREQVEQQNEAIAELAEAVESLAKNQATLAGMEEHATVVLDVDAFDGIPHTVTVPPSEFENL